MKLTALEIKQQTFDKAIRGYDVAEVQAFLNLVSIEWEHLVAKNNELRDEINRLNDKLKHYERVEQALHETLQAARESAEQKLEGVEKETRNMIQKAEMDAARILQDANNQRMQVRQTILRLLDRRNEIIAGIRSYLEIAQDSLKQFTQDGAGLFALPPEMADIALQAEAEKAEAEPAASGAEASVQTEPAPAESMDGRPEPDPSGIKMAGTEGSTVSGRGDETAPTLSNEGSTGSGERDDRQSASLADNVDDILDEID